MRPSRRRRQTARRARSPLIVALIAGAVGGALAPLLLPRAARAARPAVKGAIKAGLSLYERGRETVAEWAETASDLVAEAQAERDEERQAGDAAASPSADDTVVPITSEAGGEPDRAAHG